MPGVLDNNPVMQFIVKNRGLLFPVCATALIFVILIPLPTTVMDFLLLTNIVLTMIVLMTVMYIRGPLEFSSFPSLLLALTLLRLVLNTATTRLILSNGAQGTGAAGHVIEAFGSFVAAFFTQAVAVFTVWSRGRFECARFSDRMNTRRLPTAIPTHRHAGTYAAGRPPMRPTRGKPRANTVRMIPPPSDNAS